MKRKNKRFVVKNAWLIILIRTSSFKYRSIRSQPLENIEAHDIINKLNTI